ncbi:MAG: site-2 protease family protein [Candidatus Delongbacteria bacterium]|nr:site-2 protease family protein [Candidatus Delongbacteria bacterium]
MNFNPISIPAVLVAITIHEYSHGWAANRLGDGTARYAGRLTLNPISHIDLFGTLMLVLVGFGWAKPVPVNPYNLKNPKTDMIWISLAGPLSNLILAFVIAKSYILLSPGSVPAMMSGWSQSFLWFIIYTIQINIVLAWFNLIPIPPLDGFKILAGLLPVRHAAWLDKLELYGPYVFMALILSSFLTGFSIIGIMINPIINLTMNWMLSPFGG